MTFSSPPRDVVILGSTGSIGTQALDIIRRNPGRFRVAALAAGGGHLDLLARQAVEFGVAAVAVASRVSPTITSSAIRFSGSCGFHTHPLTWLSLAASIWPSRG